MKSVDSDAEKESNGRIEQSQEWKLDDTDQVETFLKEWRKRISYVAHGLTNSVSARADTSDVAQEGMLQAWLEIDRFRGTSPKQVAAWGCRVAKGHAAKLRRYHQAQRRSLSSSERIDVDESKLRRDSACDPDKKEVLAVLAQCLERLEGMQKTVVMMRVFDDCKFAEISSRLNKPESTIRSIFNRATLELGRELNKRGVGGPI